MIDKLIRLMPAMLFVAVLGAGYAVAQGAIAVGLPSDVAKDGVAIGWTVNADDEDNARKSALEQCHAFEGAPDSTLALCKVVRTFRTECVAVAMDQKEGTPGVGWAVAPSRASAESDAMTLCRATAGADRQAFCEIALSECDGD